MSDPNNPPIFEQMQQPQAPLPVNPMDDLEARVAAMVKAQVDAVEQKYAAKIAEMQARLDTAQATPAHLIPEHAGGPGLYLAATWSQWHQELSRDGKLTPEILRAAGIAEHVITEALGIAA
jgi:hypothetical protein